MSALKYKLNKTLSDKVCRAFTIAKQKHFEFGDKLQKLLSGQLRKLKNDRAIHKVKSSTGTILNSPEDIIYRFKEFY